MSNAGRISRNTLANWAGTVTSMGVLLLLTPYVLRALGEERFGVYLIGRQVLILGGLLTLGMRSAVNRFVTQSIVKRDHAELNTTLSTMLVFYLLMGIIGCIGCIAFGVISPSFFLLDDSLSTETIVLFVSLGIGFLLNLGGLVYKSLLVGYQRFDLLNIGKVIQECGRALLVVAAFVAGWRTLEGFAAALLGATILSVGYLWFAAHRQQPMLRVRPLAASKSVAGEVIGFGLWNAVIQVGNVMVSAAPPLIVGRLLGADQVAYYAIPMMITTQIHTLVLGMSSTLAPVAAGTLVTRDREQFRSLLLRGSRAAGMICFPLGAILLVQFGPFVTLWMGPDFTRCSVIFAVLMASMFGRIAHSATNNVLVGGGRIRGMAYIQIVAAISTLTLPVLLVMKYQLGVLGVALGVSAPLFLSHSIAMPFYASRQIGVSLLQYYRQAYAGPLVSAVGGAGAAWVLGQWLVPATWPVLIAESAISLCLSGIIIWRTCLDKSMRARIVGSLPWRVVA